MKDETGNSLNWEFSRCPFLICHFSPSLITFERYSMGGIKGGLGAEAHLAKNKVFKITKGLKEKK